VREDGRGQVALSDAQEASLVDRAIREEVSLAAYDPAWAAQFVAERRRLLAQFPQLIGIEHFGSTAIPGMPAKPIVDILAGVESMAIADALFELKSALAVKYRHDREAYSEAQSAFVAAVVAGG
jgi:GrpB-like predicted nucleotidyltransferase (UPF0157 family)